MSRLFTSGFRPQTKTPNSVSGLGEGPTAASGVELSPFQPAKLNGRLGRFRPNPQLAVASVALAPWVFSPLGSEDRRNHFHSTLRLRHPQRANRTWKSLVTSYPPCEVKVCESETSRGDGLAVGPEGEIIAAAVAVGKWESRDVGGISKRSGKPGFGFPRSGFSTAGAVAASCH